MLIEMQGPTCPGSSKENDCLGRARGGFFKMKFKLSPERWRYQRLASGEGMGEFRNTKTQQFSLSKGKNSPLSFQEWGKGRWQASSCKDRPHAHRASSSPDDESILWPTAHARIFIIQAWCDIMCQKDWKLGGRFRWWGTKMVWRAHSKCPCKKQRQQGWKRG